MDLKELENNNIDLLIQRNKLIILEFYTSWCPSCKMVAMTLEEYEEEHPEVFILQVNADENKDLANLYHVRTAPTLLFISNGEIKDTHHGFIDVDDLDEIVQNLINEN